MSSTYPNPTAPVTRAVSTIYRRNQPPLNVYRESVTLLVGANKELYTCHKDLLCFYSDFFRAAFDGSSKEAVERKIELPDVDTDVFEAFQYWLYTQSWPENKVEPNDFPEWSLLVKLWIFGDQHQIPLLQNRVMALVIYKIEDDQSNPLFLIQEVYENTTSSSQLREAVVDMVTHKASSLKETDGETRLADQALLDITNAMNRISPNGRHYPRALCRGCHYHVHAKGEHC
ncbi:hypothetical protein M436DRAFT_65314 [Aureobasidium namibiae CBS 147.97]|uniref:BTB domain-containing protein n=1 Tax=Aureobasidium namibiae CBS 147.97 TaxID=1043004 RepID=A0A074WFP1_9PEZI